MNYIAVIQTQFIVELKSLLQSTGNQCDDEMLHA